MRVSNYPAAIAALCILPSVVSAQAAAGSTMSCDSVLNAAHVDTTHVRARAYLIRRDGGVLTPHARELVLETILAHFKAPQPLQLPVFQAGPARLRMLQPESLGDSLAIRDPLVYGVYDFVLARSGLITNIVATVPSMVPGFDRSVIQAIRAAGGDSMPALVPRALDLDSLALEFRVTTGAEDVRFRVPPTTLFTATFPRVRLVDAKPIGPLPPPTYPDDERDEGRDGEVLLRIVVDASGAPVISTLEVLHATSSSFALAAARALARYHFTPAHVGACGVPQVVELPFWFSLRP